jgi:alpha-tubulin suppressor-like RCC1 family protein
MFHCNRATRKAAILLCAALVTDVAIAAPPTLQSIAVTPAVRSLPVGQKQRYTAKGTFSDESTQVLGAAISNMALGDTDTCVLLTSGGVDCWGKNDAGQLGDGTTVDSLIPRPVKWITTATAMAFAEGHGCAVLASGAVQCWGAGGQLGNGTATDSTRPVRVTGIRSAVSVAAGSGHSCALLASGAVKCWGANGYGELGNGATGYWSSIPVKVVGIESAVALGLSWAHSCAVLASGSVQCWGYNSHGQLGNGTTTDSNVPVPVKGINSATAVASGDFFNCALLANGTVQCWGHNGFGVLGDGSSGPDANSSVPVPVTGINTAVAITAGAFHACAVLSNGSVVCWGYNMYGQLGFSPTTSPSFSSTPVLISGITAPVRLAAGSNHTCALLADGAMRCWGLDNEGQLGNRRRSGNTPNPRPVNVIGTPGVVWESSDPAKATITVRGLATGVGTGNATITATTAGFVNDNAVLAVK